MMLCVFMDCWSNIQAHHVEVSQSTKGSPEDRPSLDRLDPQEVGEEHTEDGYTLVVVGTSNRSGDVTRDDGNHPRGNKPRPWTSQLLGEVVGNDGCEGGEERGQEHTHVTDVNGDIDQVHDVI